MLSLFSGKRDRVAPDDDDENLLPPPPKRERINAPSRRAVTIFTSPKPTDFVLSLRQWQISELIGFPTSLAVCSKQFYWNVTCGIKSSLISPIDFIHITHVIFSQEERNEAARLAALNRGAFGMQWCEFGAPMAMTDEVPELRLVLIFPNMDLDFDTDEQVQRKWTEGVMWHVFFQFVDRRYMPWKAAYAETQKIGLKAERKSRRYIPRPREIGCEPQRPTISHRIPNKNLAEVWKEIVARTEEPEYREFKGVRLVAMGRFDHCKTWNTASGSMEDAWLNSGLDDYMDMDYMPLGSMEVRMASSYSVHR